MFPGRFVQRIYGGHITNKMMDDEFEKFCRRRYEKICAACELLNIVNDESFESYKVANYEYLESIYINSMGDRTIH